MAGFDPSSVASWEAYADFGSWMVIIGVIGEGIEIGIKIFERRWGWLEKWYKKREFCIDVVGAAFWILVVLGLMIELRGNHKARLIADRENSDLKVKAGQAYESAALANERAALANERAAKIALSVEELRSIELTLSNSTAMANDRATKLEWTAFPRSIKDPRASGLNLRKFGAVNIAVMYEPDDDSQHLMVDLAPMFGMAGWIRVTNISATNLSGPITIASIVPNPNIPSEAEKIDQAATALLGEFVRNGIAAWKSGQTFKTPINGALYRIELSIPHRQSPRVETMVRWMGESQLTNSNRKAIK